MEEQILIFRTSVRNARDIKHIAALFTLCPQIYKWNVDMEDWEKVGVGSYISAIIIRIYRDDNH